MARIVKPKQLQAERTVITTAVTLFYDVTIKKRPVREGYGAYLTGGIGKQNKTNREACYGKNEVYEGGLFDPDKYPPRYTVTRRAAKYS